MRVGVRSRSEMTGNHFETSYGRGAPRRHVATFSRCASPVDMKCNFIIISQLFVAFLNFKLRASKGSIELTLSFELFLVTYMILANSCK